MDLIQLEIAEVVKETIDTISVSLNVPEHLKSQFNYKPGQYITFEGVVNGEKLRRSYSLCSNPFQDVAPKVAIKRVDGGRFSNHANDNFKAGDTVSVMSPIGNFVADVASYNAKNYVLLGAGSGITPVMSILKAVLSEEPNSKVTLVYANSNQDNIIFKDELNNLAQANIGRFNLVNHISGEKGRLNASMVKDYISSIDNPASATYFMCGPQGFMDAVEDGLNQLSIPENKVNREYFAAKEKDADEEVEFDGEIIDREVTVVVDGEEKTFMVESDQSILEAAIDNDLDPPYSCQAGVCTACRGMCTSGKVHMDEMEGLSDEEIEEGYVLTCQSHPITDNVKIEFSL